MRAGKLGQSFPAFVMPCEPAEGERSEAGGPGERAACQYSGDLGDSEIQRILGIRGKKFTGGSSTGWA